MDMKSFKLVYVHPHDTCDAIWNGERVKVLDSDDNFICFAKSIDFAEGYLEGKYGAYALRIPIGIDFKKDIWA